MLGGKEWQHQSAYRWSGELLEVHLVVTLRWCSPLHLVHAFLDPDLSRRMAHLMTAHSEWVQISQAEFLRPVQSGGGTCVSVCPANCTWVLMYNSFLTLIFLWVYDSVCTILMPLSLKWLCQSSLLCVPHPWYLKELHTLWWSSLVSALMSSRCRMNAQW